MVIPKANSPHSLFFCKIYEIQAMRKGTWKLYGHQNDLSGNGIIGPIKDQLYLTNLIMNESERKNLVSQYREKVEEQLKECQKLKYY